MKKHILFAAILLTTSWGSAAAADVDRRFEGTWTGVETLFIDDVLYQRGEAPEKKPTVIAIGDAGRTLAIVEGLYSGRYAVSPKWLPSRDGVSGGNTLVFAMMERPTTTSLYRDACKLVLSADGNTLTETGHASVSRMGGDLHGTTVLKLCRISGTFHRQTKK